MKRPNIVLITIDCLRADHLSCYGDPGNISPTIDRLAAKGLRADHSYSVGSWTNASFVGMLCSTFPFRLSGALGVVGDRQALATCLRDAGYRTGAFHSNSYISSVYGYDRGFTRFAEGLPLNESAAGAAPLWLRAARWLIRNEQLQVFLRRTFAPGRYLPARAIADQALEWLGAESDTPYFAWIHFMDVHEPNVPPKKYVPAGVSWRQAWDDWRKVVYQRESLPEQRNANLQAMYDASIRYTDDEIARLLGLLPDRDNTVLIITADHGQGFGEHGHYWHGVYLYNEFVRVPLIISGGPVTPAVLAAPTSGIDIGPTVLGLAGLTAPGSYEGVDILASPPGPSRHVFCEEGRNEGSPGLFTPGTCMNLAERSTACVTSDWKMIRNSDGTEELYRLSDDPRELRNVVMEQADTAEQLRQAIREHEADTAPPPAGDSELSPEEISIMEQRLRDLGYV